MSNVIQIRDEQGNALYPITDVSLIMGLENRTGMRVVPVDSLPTASADTVGVIYMVTSTKAISITKLVDGAYSWVSCGTLDNVDLSGYATKAELDQLGQKVSYLKVIGPDGFYICDENGNVAFKIDGNGIAQALRSVGKNANDVVTFADLPLGEDFQKNALISFLWDENTATRYTLIRVFHNTVQGGVLSPRVDCPFLAESKYYSAIELATAKGYDLVINCGLGRTSGTADVEGVLIQDGEILHNKMPLDHLGTMPLVVDTAGNLGYKTTEYNARAEDLISDGIIQAFDGFAPLVVDYVAFDGQSAYQSVPHYNQAAQRQILGQFDNGDYAIITCEGRGYANSAGWTIPEAQAICLRHGLKFAYNCDGGASTQTVVERKQLATYYSRKIPTYLYFKY